MLLCLGALFTVIFIYKAIAGYIAGRAAAAAAGKPIAVETAIAHYTQWQPTLKAVGSVRAIRGVNVTTELAGMVRTIYFKPGAEVKQGELLVELNIDTDVALLHSLQAQATLAEINYNRDKAQYAIQAVSKAVLDTDTANLKSTQAQVAQQLATVNKKIIRAPFSGRLGVNAVNPGQYLNPGDKIVNLQSFDPIYVDFYLPQQMLEKLAVGQNVTLAADSVPNKVFRGKITTIEPMVETATRNVEIEATLPNPKYELKPGMFAPVTITTGKPQTYLTVPQTAVSFNSYGEIIYVVKSSPLIRPAATFSHKGRRSNAEREVNGKAKWIVTQTFVTVGETRDEQTAILRGLKPGDRVVTAGQLKLRNGSAVSISEASSENSKSGAKQS